MAMTKLNIRPIRELGFTDELPESGASLEENALQKARFVHNRFKVDCFAEDSGLEVEALGGEPGVHSARYSGDGKDALSNFNLVLSRMQGQANRAARFRAVIALIVGGREYLFEGVLHGNILNTASGTLGFGYDPIFAPKEEERSLAQLSAYEKNRISHRGMALRAMMAFLGNKVG